MTQALNKNRNKILALASVVAVKAATESKKAMKLTLAEQKELIRNKGIVSRVYITRGDEKLNEDNERGRLPRGRVSAGGSVE